MLDQDLRQLGLVELPSGLRNKSMCWLPASHGQESIEAGLLFLPRFASRSFVEPLSPAVACELLSASNRLTLELDDYDWYSAGLDLLWPRPGNARRKHDGLERLTGSARCYTLGIDRTAGVDSVVELVRSCCERTHR